MVNQSAKKCGLCFEHSRVSLKSSFHGVKKMKCLIPYEENLFGISAIKA